MHSCTIQAYQANRDHWLQFVIINIVITSSGWVSMPVIQTEKLSVYYGRQRGIRELDLSVNAGEIYGFLGPNGAGKTTTLRVLMDIIRPSAGRASMFGKDCQKHGVEIRKRVGYLPGELKLYPSMRVEDYFQMVSTIRRCTNYRAQASDLCERLNLDPSRTTGTLSHGNKQKVGLVAAFLGQPELLILDEPTTGLDPLVQQAVLELVRAAKAEGRTTMFSSHILSEVQAICDRVGIIRDGQMITTERIEELRRSQFHRLRLRFEKMPPVDAFKEFGARELYRSEHDLTLEIHENLNQVLAWAVDYGIIDLEDQPFSLEEIFLTHYGKRGNGKDA